MKQKSRKYLGFTIIELLTVTVILGIIVPSIISIYSFMIKSNKEFNLRQTAIQQGYEFFEKLNILMQDYTIDYEEYYNRQMVGCVGGGGTGSNFKWNIGLSGYCTEFTAYGNQNSTKRKIDSSNNGISGTYHDIYDCSSVGDNNFNNGLPRAVKQLDCGKIGSRQSFGQYKNLFVDVNGVGNADDDRDLGRPVDGAFVGAIVDADNIQELYLISHDGKSRLFLRRKLVAQDKDVAQYKIQILRLRGFDAGQDHNFDSNNKNGLYDGQIDTWACDTSMGFEPSDKTGRQNVGGAYSGYYLPKDADDCWIELTYGNTNIYTWNMSISPLDDPDLYWADESRQINPYMKILAVNGVYLPTSNADDTINSFNIPIETTINMKDFYRE